jgi:signal transduction histidine kinase
MSAHWRWTGVLWPLTICLVSTVFFGSPDRWGQAIVWACLVFAGQGFRLFSQIQDPGPDPDAIAKRLREHRARVLFSAIAWGSAGYLLFDREDMTRQLALTVVLVSTGIAFSMSASSHAVTLKSALPLLLGPIILSLLLSPQPYMWVMAMMGTSFYFLMRRLVTDRGQQLEETLNLRLLAQEAQEEKQRFFAAASHDLRQPLQALSLYHGVLSNGGPRPDVVQHMGECIEALDRLLTGVLDISRLDSGKVTPNLVPIHLPALMFRLANMHEPAMRKKGLRFRLHTQDVWLLSDPTLLERILSNLMSNATRYTESGGVLFAARKRGQRVALQVIDPGIGIDAEAFESIFSEFTQLNNPARDPTKGSGVGLATVQRMVRLLGQDISLKSTPGKGSCFQLAIPITSAPAPVASPTVSATPEASSRSLAHKRLLVVEDNALVADALSVMLKAWGLDVSVATDANSAMEALTLAHFDAVISDWRLPGTEDGLAVLRFASVHQPALQLAALLTGDNVEALDNEFPVITKPVRALRLRALLSAHLK